MSEFFIQEQQLGKVTRTIVKDQAGRSLFYWWGAGAHEEMRFLYMQ